MIKVYKAPRHSFGWTDPRGVFGGTPKPNLFAHKRLIEDTDTGELTEYEHAYIHGAAEVEQGVSMRSYQTPPENHTKGSSI